ncbi:MAG TPA: hypothetical protein EYH38_03740 [Leucothrix sp.]|nr:hypothetical protein [Leucothrix sp.]
MDDCFLVRPKGAIQSAQYCLAGLAKGRCSMPQAPIGFNLRLVLNALNCSVPIKPILLEY